MMKENLTKLGIMLFAASILVVPTLAFPGQGPKATKYTADLIYNDVVYGKATFNTNPENNGYELEVEVEECTLLADSTVDVFLHQNYYNMIHIGELLIDSEGDGSDSFNTDFMVNEFTLLVEGDITLSTENGWQEWVKPSKEMVLNVSPSTLNQKSNGNWVTLKVFVPVGSEVTDVTIYVDDVEINDYILTLKDGQITVKLSRSELVSIAEPGEAEIQLTFNLNGAPVQLLATIHVIKMGVQPLTTSTNNDEHGKGKAKGRKK